MTKKPIIWISIIRIFAVSLIFLFHFCKFYQFPTYLIDFYGIGLFCFISGYLCYQKNVSPHIWLLRRIKSIFIPFWIVIIPALILNHIVGYKESSLINDWIVFIGGAWFLSDPVYVISWFITLIMLFYFTIYIVQLNKNLVSHLVIIIIAAFVYYYWFPSRTIYYFALFILGFLLRSLKKKSQGVRIFLKNIFSRNVGEKLFLLQNYSYSIFLIHGSFQLLFIIF